MDQESGSLDRDGGDFQIERPMRTSLALDGANVPRVMDRDRRGESYGYLFHRAKKQGGTGRSSTCRFPSQGRFPVLGGLTLFRSSLHLQIIALGRRHVEKSIRQLERGEGKQL